jgi:hypothetical protein
MRISDYRHRRAAKRDCSKANSAGITYTRVAKLLQQPAMSSLRRRNRFL